MITFTLHLRGVKAYNCRCSSSTCASRTRASRTSWTAYACSPESSSIALSPPEAGVMPAGLLRPGARRRHQQRVRRLVAAAHPGPDGRCRPARGHCWRPRRRRREGRDSGNGDLRACSTRRLGTTEATIRRGERIRGDAGYGGWCEIFERVFYECGM
jgi:hypothetical protein